MTSLCRIRVAMKGLSVGMLFSLCVGLALSSCTSMPVMKKEAALAAPVALNAEYQKVATYKFGESREALTVAADQIRAASGKPEQQQNVQQLCSLLRSPQATYESKEFACRQLALIGSAESVPALAAHLTGDEKLSNMARYALERIPGEAAVEALRAALGKTSGLNKIGMINSLGVRGDAKSVGRLGKLLKNKDPQIAAAAAKALGKIGGVEATGLLAKAVKRGQSDPQVLSTAKDSYILCAESLLAQGKKAEAIAIFNEMAAPAQPLQIRLAALRGMVAADPAEGLKLVLAALKGTDPKLQAAATRFVREMPGAELTPVFAGQLSSLAPAGQVLLLDALADRGDTAARPAAVIMLTKSEDPAVRLAAIKALGKLGDAMTVTMLAQVAAASQGEERTAAQESMDSLSADHVNDALLAGLHAMADPKVRSEVIRSLAARRVNAATPELVKAAVDPDPGVQVEAYKSLEVLGEPKDIEPIIKLLVGAKSERERTMAEKALVSTCGRIENAEVRTQLPLAVLKVNKDVPVRCSLLRVLGGLGGDEALKAVRAAAKSGNAEVKDAAIRALVEWPDAGAVQELSRIARTSDEEKYRVLALRGYVRQVALPSDRPAEETLKMYQEALKIARRAEDKKMVLAGLGSASDPQVLTLVEPFLKDPEMQAEVVATMLSVAKAMADTCPDVAKQAVAEVEAIAKDDATKQQASEIKEKVKKYEDYVTAWQVSGPYSESGKNFQQLFDTTFAPEDPKAKDVAWKMLKGAVGPEKTWGLDLNKAIGGKQCVVYLRTNIWVPKAQKATIHAGSDDGLKIWLNGAVVSSQNVSRAMEPGKDQVPVELREGWNSVMLKVTQGDGDFCASFRVRNPDASVIEGLKVKMD